MTTDQTARLRERLALGVTSFTRGDVEQLLDLLTAQQAALEEAERKQRELAATFGQELWAYNESAKASLRAAHDDLEKAEAALETLRRERDEAQTMLDLVTSSKSPCGHWSAYAVTNDGGKLVTCLQCRAEAAERERDEALARVAWHSDVRVQLRDRAEAAEARYAELGRERDRYEQASEMVATTLHGVTRQLDEARAKLLAIAALVNAYHNDGTRLTAAQTLAAIAGKLGKPFDEAQALPSERSSQTTKADT